MMSENPSDQTIMDAVTMAAFLFNMEADKGYNYLYGGVRLGEVINSFCRFTKLERPLWEEVVWPKPSSIKPERDKG